MRFLWCLFLLAAGEDPDSVSLSGHVWNAKDSRAVSKAEILLRAEGPRREPFLTTSDEQGRFEMARIPPGRYRLTAQRKGFLPGSYGARRVGHPGTILVLEPGRRVEAADIRLTPCGVISGRVMASDGEPMVEAEVRAWQRQARRGHWEWRLVANSKTNDLGEYRLFDLKPGKYAVSAVAEHQFGTNGADRSARPRPPEADVPTLYPGAISFDRAAILDVVPGARIGGVDVSMLRSRVFRVAGKVVAEGGKDSLEDVYVELNTRGGHLSFGRQYSTRGGWDGSFEIAGIPAGSFDLCARDLARPDRRAVMPLEVSGDMDRVLLVVAGGGEVTGRVRVEDGPQPDLTGALVWLERQDGAREHAEPRKDGSFGIKDLAPNEYSVQLTNLPDGLYLKSAVLAGADVRDSGFRVTAEVPIRLDLVAAPGAGQVEGVVLDDQEHPAAGVTAVLVPDTARRARSSLFQSVSTDEHGRFRFQGVEPGEYTLFAWENVDDSAWLEAEFLKTNENSGTAATVPENGSVTTKLRVLASR